MKKSILFLMLPMLLLSGCSNQSHNMGKSTSDTAVLKDKSQNNDKADAKEKVLPKYPSKPPELNLFNSDAINHKELWGTMNGHDPAIFKDDASGKYYVYSTDVEIGSHPRPGAQIRRSNDLITWEFVGWALEDGIPEEIQAWTNATNIWAPDIIKAGNEYRLYCSASTFGSQKSAIFLAVSNSPEGPFKYRGIVVKTDTGDPVNAIDANLVVEEGTGQQYMVYGSFWSGINILKIDNETGLAAEEGFGKSIARRPRSVDGAIEGPYIRYNKDTGYYYLFVSYGSLFSDYHIRVGRSKSVTGPYVDFNGTELTNIEKNPYEVGVKIAGGYKFEQDLGWMALGHNSVLNDNGEWFLVHHARPEGEQNWPYMQVRKLVWSEDGWPLVSPELYAGEKLQKIDQSIIAGTYDRIKHFDFMLSVVEPSEKMYLKPDKTCMIDREKGEWFIEGDYRLVIQVGNITERYVIIPSWDWEKKTTTLVLTGIDSEGRCIWGKKNNSGN
ncbi:MAG: arabinan endo,5-alpha-L-arabinosidase [Petroclostridium sp.]|uniref:arabinan endo-1,5-alpha-L-arabinosidase n=1 Tax=Petroclostridium xylanilyticum TaxID=1792311 RepID=UPI0018E3C201|nr:arabinan endo-1,5-alpha-L-arabinosidase [Petroclostridium xylanilyticum]MDK2810681.1 arabinan endo,5-alpha-L-arabinosidase [Petroclostridium sp.]